MVQVDAPPEGFDLILLSEVLYYLDPSALMRAARVTKGLAAAGGRGAGSQ